jgi:hypothetical protein
MEQELNEKELVRKSIAYLKQQYEEDTVSTASWKSIAR